MSVITQEPKRQDALTQWAVQAACQSGGPAWLEQWRAVGTRRLEKLGMPHGRLEAWRQTSLKNLLATAWSPAPQAEPSAATVQALDYDGLDAFTLVFVNGHFAAHLSQVDGLPEGVILRPLTQAVQSCTALASHLGTACAHYEDHAFEAFNRAAFNDGAYLEIPAGVSVEKPIHLFFVAQPDPAQPTINVVRNLIVAGRGAQARVIETYGGPTDGVYFTQAVTEMALDEAAAIDHVKVQRESPQAYHLALQAVTQARASNFTSRAVNFGAQLSRDDLATCLDGEGIECVMNGLYMIDGQRHHDTHSHIDHAQPHCASHEKYKGVLDGRATAVFNGSIMVRPDAQKTDALQNNAALLLSEDATIDSQPQLEIFADDVKCTHGATVGQLDADVLFYLKSRALSDRDARALLTYAFANDVVEDIKVEPVRSALEALILARFAQSTGDHNA